MKLISAKAIGFCLRKAGLLVMAACFFFTACKVGAVQNPVTVEVGAEVLIAQHLDDLSDKRVGLVMNPTSRIHGTHMLDTLMHHNVNITALFAPEHGFRGDRGAGETIQDGIDEATGLPVYSLYGNTRKPTPEMLENVDVLIFDMQDVGARFYTYISTMGKVMEAASEQKKELWVLDRPNPAGGEYIAGWILEKEYRSFVGEYPIPVAHGMTIGELAQMIAAKEWVDLPNGINLRVIAMNDWERQLQWRHLDMEWIPPSPNLPTAFHAWMYLGTCFFEGSNLSEGRGTEDPFLIVGSPGLDVESVLQYDWENEYGVSLEQLTFTPQSLPGIAVNPKHQNETSNGIRIRKKDEEWPEDPVSIGLELLRLSLMSDSEAKTNNFLYNLAGTAKIDKLLQGDVIGGMAQSWESDIKKFREQREPFLLY